MKRSILIVMLDVMVLSVLALNLGKGSGRLVVPAYRWSELVEKGLAKEQRYQDAIEHLKAQAAAATKRETEAAQRETEAKRLAEAARERAALERDSGAEADMRAKLADEKRSIALEEAGRAQRRQEEAEQRSREAEKAANAAQLRAELAAQKEQATTQRIMQAEERIAQLARQTGEERGKSEEALEEALRAKAEAEEAKRREAEARAQIATLRSDLETTKAKAEVAEEERIRSNRAVEESQKYIIRLRDRITDVQVAAKEAEILRGVAEERQKEANDKLEDIAQEKEESVWLRRDRAMRLLEIYLSEEDRNHNTHQEFRRKLYLPIINLGDKSYLIGDADSFGLNWRQLHKDQHLSTLSFRIGGIADSTVFIEQRGNMHIDARQPQLAYLPLPLENAKEALPPLGMEALKAQRLQNALLFKSEHPNRSVRVEITPELQGSMLTVAPSKATPLLRSSGIAPGDMLFSETGHFIGIMLSKTSCYVQPVDKPSKGLSISLRKPAKNKYYSAFIEGARKRRRLEKQ